MDTSQNLSALSPDELSIISEAENKLTAACGHDVVLVAYNSK